MSPPQKSDGIDFQRKGFLSKRERQYLAGKLDVVESGEANGDLEITEDYEYTIKSRIKSKTRNAINDLGLVKTGLPPSDVQEILHEDHRSDVDQREKEAFATLESAKLHGMAVADADSSDVSGKETVGVVMKLVRRVMTADDKIRGAFDVMTDVFADYRTKEEIIQYIDETWPEE